MPTDADPIVGNWYNSPEKQQRFEVVAVDEDAGTVEIQHFDGDIEELDLDTWYEWDIVPIEAPENWTGPMDEVYREEIAYSETDIEPEEWVEDLDELPRPTPGAAPTEDWGKGYDEEEEEPGQGEE